MFTGEFSLKTDCIGMVIPIGTAQTPIKENCRAVRIGLAWSGSSFLGLMPAVVLNYLQGQYVPRQFKPTKPRTFRQTEGFKDFVAEAGKL